MSNCVTSTDEASKSRKTCADAAGRTTGAWEDPSGVGYVTAYSYDGLGNMIQSFQSGQVRSYTFDGLSRLLNATTPETGTTCYGTYSGSTCLANGYDGNGNLIKKTDARGVVITYSYDAGNRLTQKSYSDSTPTANTIMTPRTALV